MVDDRQSLGSGLGPAAGVRRRAGRRPVGLVFATRVPGQEVAGLPKLAVGGLADSDARILLDSVLTGPLDARVHDQVIADTHGKATGPPGTAPRPDRGPLAGGFALSGGVPRPAGRGQLGRQIEALAVRPGGCCTSPQPTLPATRAGWRAAGRLGISPEAATPAPRRGGGVRRPRRFRHPLVRSAAYRSASLGTRPAGATPQAQATDRAVDPDRRAWHLARPPPGPTGGCGRLERSAGRARPAAGGRRGCGIPRARRHADARRDSPGQPRLGRGPGQASRRRPGAALRLVTAAEAGPLDDLRLARTDLLSAEIAYSAAAPRPPDCCCAPPLTSSRWTCAWPGHLPGRAVGRALAGRLAPAPWSGRPRQPRCARPEPQGATVSDDDARRAGHRARRRIHRGRALPDARSTSSPTRACAGPTSCAGCGPPRW